MKTIILTLALFCAKSLTAQWTYKEITDGFDDPYHVAYTESDGSAYLKLENSDGKIAFFVKGGYYCDDKLLCDFVFSTVCVIDSFVSDNDMILLSNIFNATLQNPMLFDYIEYDICMM